MCCVTCFCCFKQKTAYEMRISDWGSDVCSSDLGSSLTYRGPRVWSDLDHMVVSPAAAAMLRRPRVNRTWDTSDHWPLEAMLRGARWGGADGSMDGEDRKSVVSGKSVSVRVALGGRRTIKKKK